MLCNRTRSRPIDPDKQHFFCCLLTQQRIQSGIGLFKKDLGVALVVWTSGRPAFSESGAPRFDTRQVNTCVQHLCKKAKRGLFLLYNDNT